MRPSLRGSTSLVNTTISRLTVTCTSGICKRKDEWSRYDNHSRILRADEIWHSCANNSCFHVQPVYDCRRLYCKGGDVVVDMTRVILLRSSTCNSDNSMTNEGYSTVEDRLQKLNSKTLTKSEILNTDSMSDEDRLSLYHSVVPLSVKYKFQIRRVFGSRRFCGTYFGLQVPALLIYNESDGITDVFPKRFRGQFRTISDYISELERD